MAVQLSTKSLGSIVKIKENGVLVNFLVLAHNYPAAGRTLLLRNDIYDMRKWHSGEHNGYIGSEIDTWANQTYLNLIDANIRKQIVDVPIQCTAFTKVSKEHRCCNWYWSSGGAQVHILGECDRSGTYTYNVPKAGGKTTQNRKAFLLSCTETGMADIRQEGQAPQFLLSPPWTIAKYNGQPTKWWTRTPEDEDKDFRICTASTSGNLSRDTGSYGTRPAFTLPSTMYVADDGTVTTNRAPNAPTAISLPGKIEGGKSFSISWGGASDPDNNLSGYRLQRSVNGGSWSQVYAGAAASYTDNLAFGTANTVAYRVQAYDNGGLSSGWKTGSTANVINNRAPGMPGAITLPGTINGGQKFTVSWGAATDADGNLSGYYCERSTNGGSSWTRIYQGSATSASDTLAFGSAASVLYRVQAYDAHSAVSGWRTSASKTVVNNRAPNAPGTITVPVSVVGGKTLTVTWAAASDPDGNLSGYKLERSAAGGAWTQVYAGNALSFNDAITKGWATVAYRVRAYDAYNAHSGYTTSQTRTVDNNTAPTITCSVSGNLGTKTDGFSVTYTVADAEKDKVTVVEAMDGVQKRSYTAALGATNTFAVTGDYFMKLLNGPHTMKLTAADPGGKSTSVTLTFTKAVHACSVTLAQPMETDALVKRAVMNVVRSIPADAQFLVEVTNNAFDASPAWEDATQFVKAGINYVFNNKQAAAGKSGYNFRITASRANGGQGGYISSIGGALE